MSLCKPSREPNQGEVENSSLVSRRANRHRRTPGMPCIRRISAGLSDADYLGTHTPSTALDDASEIPASGARCFSGQQIDRAILLHRTDDPAHELLTHDLAATPRPGRRPAPFILWGLEIQFSQSTGGLGGARLTVHPTEKSEVCLADCVQVRTDFQWQ